MKLQLRFLGFLTAFLMIFAPVTAFAAPEQVDFSKKGSITVNIRYEGEPVGGAILSLYQVAELAQDKDGQYIYKFTDDFMDCGQTLDNLQSTELTANLAKWALDTEAEFDFLIVDELGTVEAEELPVGLYLLVQYLEADGYKDINPFLVTLPIKDGESLVYDVDASPKCQIEPETSETPPPPETPEETTTEPPDTPPDVPYTGQLWWPVPILAFAGLIFFTIGWVRRYNSR